MKDAAAPDLFAVIDATWPAADTTMAGGFRIREGRGGGSRVSCASLEAPFAEADIDAAIAAHRGWGQTPRFMIRPGEEALDAALAARGYEAYDPVVIYETPVRELPGAEAAMIEVPPHWPPLAVLREIWDAGDIGPARLAVMERAAGPKAALLGRSGNRAAGVAFVALHAGTAMLHALFVPPAFRRRGLAQEIMRESLRWSAAQGAERFTLVVTRANAPARAVYERMGMQATIGYHYRREAAK
ncbi:GNAT family N-acetyltransferase [Sinirhodobacter populi]|uniref:GNAT family N-acetyltransferase n=1 Tax=Paenirhodobacter populi TaxID=2306993 RepID=A0A443KKW7_9RHOB|nr:GNAT family N-acetyltransferase [Sinirhodobacter populi]RWR33374.1 GNAT family N-acetyltransferase [Sinirhodobacter populi]